MESLYALAELVMFLISVKAGPGNAVAGSGSRYGGGHTFPGASASMFSRASRTRRRDAGAPGGVRDRSAASLQAKMRIAAWRGDAGADGRFDRRFGYTAWEAASGAGSGALADPRLDYRFEVRERGLPVGYIVAIGD